MNMRNELFHEISRNCLSKVQYMVPEHAVEHNFRNFRQYGPVMEFVNLFRR